MASNLRRWLFDRATLIGLGAAVAGVVIMTLSKTLHDATIAGVRIEPIVSELGGAFLIAGLLALTLERVLVTRLTEEVRSGVEAYYLTYGLPKEFGDEVIYVREVRLARKDYIVRVRIRNHETLDDKVHVEIHVSYTVINFSNEEIEYRQLMAIEEVGEDTARIVRASRTGADLSSERVMEMPGAKVDEVVRVRPNARDPRNRIEYLVRKVFAKAYGSDWLILSQPAVNVHLMLDEKPDDLDFEVTIGHRAQNALKTDGTRFWRLDKAFFPGASINFEWKKKPPAVPEPGAISGGRA
jgi:hypothetical protein